MGDEIIFGEEDGLQFCVLLDINEFVFAKGVENDSGVLIKVDFTEGKNVVGGVGFGRIKILNVENE